MIIEALSRKIISYLLSSGSIEQEVDYYMYGIEITLSSMLNILLVFVIGLVFSAFEECVVFLCAFILIRQFSGGYHASSYFKCNAALCCTCILVVLLQKLTYDLITIPVSICISIVCIAVIIIRCPVENANKPIPKERRPFYKMLSAFIGICYACVGIMLIYFGNCFGTILLYTLCAVTILIPAADLKKRGVKNEEKGEQGCDSY